MSVAQLKPTHKAIQQYYAALKEYAEHKVEHEGAIETAFSRLLADAAKSNGCTLIPKLPTKAKGKSIIPDGTVKDSFFVRGYWEAKDTHDDLDAEIRKKIAKNYPLINTIFEDTRTGVLYQNGREANRFDLTQPSDLADLLNAFFAFTEPEHDNFEKAVNDFKERVPELAKKLADIIKQAHDKNSRFQQAFGEFFALVQTALNPNIRRDAVDEMLVQHLLTERLFRKIFHDEEFTRRNVIAAEVEKVIAALVSKAFSRDEFLKALDRFYKAIEAAAETIDDFAEKQHFLNTVYERFFQGYSVKLADTHGIVYTPQPIVDFMCASVEEVLKSEFGLTLGSKGVNILDPCTGTGNFIVNLLRRIPGKDLPRVYKEQLFANEVMLLPYYIAALNIEHAYYERTGDYEPFEGLCFVDTLDLAEERQPSLFAEKNTERVERQRKTPITVIIGNPPYNMGQIDENDNNQNRTYAVADHRIRCTYAKDSGATLKNKLYDPYVKFFRWATDRLSERNGIVCFVSNNSFVDQIAFDGMRKHLLKDFTRIFHLHLEGNVRHDPKLAGTTYNVFGIQVGVGITLAIRHNTHQSSQLWFHRIDKNLRRFEKLRWLTDHEDCKAVKWHRLHPDDRNTWLVSPHSAVFSSFTPLGNKATKASDTESDAVFRLYSLGVVTSRDEWVYAFELNDLERKIDRHIQNFNYEVFRLGSAKKLPHHIEEFINADARFLKWTDRLKEALGSRQSISLDKTKLRPALYRPFCQKFIYFDHLLNQRRYQQHYIFPDSNSELENRAICLTTLGSEKPFMALFTNNISDLHLVGAGCGSQCFPFYVYDEDGGNRRENITDWALAQFRERYASSPSPGFAGVGARRAGEGKRDSKSLKTPHPARKASPPSPAKPGEGIQKWDIFYYVYGILHHPGYRTKFADNLKRELPRIPFAPDFWAFANAGKELARLHLDYEKLEPYELKFMETPGMPLSYHVEKMKLSKDKTTLKVNESLTLAGIPPEVFEYRLGNRSALDWVIDQYQISEDKRSGIRSDPNRADDPEYIVRLVGQVVRVSVETVKIVKELPAEYAT